MLRLMNKRAIAYAIVIAGAIWCGINDGWEQILSGSILMAIYLFWQSRQEEKVR